MSNDLSTFLLHRIAEDEAVARDVLPSRWPYEPYGHRTGGRVPGISEDWQGTAFRPVSQHIARHDPARVLAECEAKRRIVVRCQEMLTAAVPMAVHLAQQTLTDLARPHADHPDYRQEWKP